MRGGDAQLWARVVLACHTERWVVHNLFKKPRERFGAIEPVTGASVGQESLEKKWSSRYEAPNRHTPEYRRNEPP